MPHKFWHSSDILYKKKKKKKNLILKKWVDWGQRMLLAVTFNFFFHEKYYAYECFESTKGQAWTLTTNMQLFIKKHDVFNEKVTISYFFTKKNKVWNDKYQGSSHNLLL